MVSEVKVPEAKDNTRLKSLEMAVDYAKTQSALNGQEIANIAKTFYDYLKETQ